jgi:hypothetical protein
MLQFFWSFASFLVWSMEEERSPIIYTVGDMLKAPMLEASTASSSSNASSGGAASDATKAEAEDAMDPRELAWSYVFVAYSVTMGRIRQLESLGYFAEGSAREPWEETVPEPNTDDAIVFKEFFAAGLRMPPYPAFTEILLKFRVQLHPLTLNSIAQPSECF